MSDMLERAAKASVEWSGYPEAGRAAMIEAREHAGVVLSAALDPFDAALNARLVERTNHPARDIQRIIAALREECLQKDQ